MEWKCAVEGCNGAPYQNKPMCGSHFGKWQRTGDPNFIAPPKYHDLAGQRFGTLLVQYRDDIYWVCACDCGNTARFTTHVLMTGDSSTKNCRVKGAHWKPISDYPTSGPITSGYTVIHSRVRMMRGSAKTHSCIKCGAPAKHWAYDHADPHGLADPHRGPYGTTIDHYQALCVPCHKTSDMEQIRATAGIKPYEHCIEDSCTRPIVLKSRGLCAYHATKAAQDRRSFTKTCEQCNSAYRTASAKQRFCSKKCTAHYASQVSAQRHSVRP